MPAFNWNTATLAVLSAAVLVGAPGATAAEEVGDPLDKRGGSMTYEVAITNLTYDQIISPPVVVAHDDRFDLFEAGHPVSDELAALAEDGMTGPLVGLLEVSDGVSDYAVASGGVPPGESVTVEVRLSHKSGRLSLAGMLVSTNDAFAGLDGYALPKLKPHEEAAIYVPAYDSGSEVNTESCDHIPGPPCGQGGVRVTEGAEGFVHVHRGVHGIADLDAADKDWRNPVARITIRRVR